MRRNQSPTTQLLALTVALAMQPLVGCDRAPSTPADTHAESEAPTNRVDIPDSVRKNLGITFAKVEARDVAQTLRVPGRFELLPTARREVRTPLGGRIELLVAENERVEVGTPLYRLDSAAWRALADEIEAGRAHVDAMVPLRAAHVLHERSIEAEVELWQERLLQLEGIRAAGGGSAAQLTEAHANLNARKAALAETAEQDAELGLQQRVAEASLRSKESQRATLMSSAGMASTSAAATDDWYEVKAVTEGVVEKLSTTPGGLVEPLGLVMTIVQPTEIRFRARALQSDLGRLRDGLAVRIAPPQGGSVALDDTMRGTLELGLSADPDTRTIELLVRSEQRASWARAGVSGYLEITLAGGKNELAIPLAAVIRDGLTPIIFRRDPNDPNKAIRMEADLGVTDGRFVVLASGVKAGDEIVVDGNYQLMLATSGSTAKGGHFHSDGTFHEGKD
ncbi:MAG: HlyD family efflux transporter periplasmic adaptor subunit [Planctomycetota bacterium]|nr:MAG: HlyD family efflux transporter periplasmic adaptor subunit [Planctomycetota bacterium]